MRRWASCLVVSSLLLSGPTWAAEAPAPPPVVPRALVARPATKPAATGSEADYGKVGSAVGVGGLYTGLFLYLSLAWWNDQSLKMPWHTRNEGWFAKDTYAGGADKLGHVWINYTLVRGMSSILAHGGWNPRNSLYVSSALSLAFWTAAEVKDGYYGSYGFSYEDMIADTGGVLLGMAFEIWPELDRRLDFRVDYLPSSGFIRETREKGVLNAPEDYDGQTYLLCYHLAAHDFSRENSWLTWTTYVDLTAGFNAMYYHPVPVDPETRREQNLFLGVSLNLQPLLDQSTSTGARALHFVTEVYQVPYTTLAVGSVDRSAPQPAVE